jgi:hypothetical protein
MSERPAPTADDIEPVKHETLVSPERQARKSASPA